MRIEVKGRNASVTQAQREQIERRFRKIGRQVSELAQLEVELSERPEPPIPHAQVAEATLKLKGVTLRAQAAESDMGRAINCCEEQLSVQVKRHRDKRRKRRETRNAQAAATGARAQL
ncbi:MAG TPA: ribosome-associated translation inhibitor RaiA [Conexibacter sp.]|jgi:putative sigma-54 modulation protein